jgi:hypothetical protein
MKPANRETRWVLDPEIKTALKRVHTLLKTRQPKDGVVSGEYLRLQEDRELASALKVVERAIREKGRVRKAVASATSGVLQS